ncbi:hypothetical protein [Flavobacterium indicum]|nr:hypothetical protein [Flavobacterium indicum]
MKNIEKLENGLSIVQLEERFELTVAEGDSSVSIEGHYHEAK